MSEELENIKLKEEIKLIKRQNRESQFNFYKAIATIIALISGFILITQPESIINRKLSEESIKRERAKLFLEWLKEDNEQKRTDAMKIIKMVFGESDNTWIRQIEDIAIQKANINSANNYLIIVDSLEKKLKILQAEIKNTSSGANDNNIKKYEILSSELLLYKKQFNEITSSIKQKDSVFKLSEPSFQKPEISTEQHASELPLIETPIPFEMNSSEVAFRLYLNPTLKPAYVWIEYGTTKALEMRTMPFVIDEHSNSNFGMAYHELFEPKTTYYYRIAAKNEKGTYYGKILSFTVPAEQFFDKLK